MLFTARRANWRRVMSSLSLLMINTPMIAERPEVEAARVAARPSGAIDWDKANNI